MIFAAAQSIAGGRAVGLMGALGLALGGYLHVIAAAAGLSVVLHAVPTAYTLVRLFGAAYLVWLGISLIRTKAPGVEDVPVMKPKTGRRAFIEGITVEMLNPKTALFFLAFLPQFTDPSVSLPIWAQFLILGSIVNAMFGLADVIAVFLASGILTRLGRSHHAARWLQKAGGGILVALGLRLALAKN